MGDIGGTGDFGALVGGGTAGEDCKKKSVGGYARAEQITVLVTT